MKIIHVSTGIQRIPPDRAGGPERHLTLLSRQLARTGHDVTIVDRRRGPADPPAGLYDGVRIVRLAAPWLPASWLESRVPLLPWVRSGLNTVLFTLSVHKYLGQASEFDVVNVHVISSAFLLAVLGRRIRAKLIYNHHAAFWPSVTGGLVGALLSVLGRFTMRRVRAVIVLNDTVRDYFLTRYGLPAPKVVTLPSGVDTTFFYPDASTDNFGARHHLEGRRIVLFVGRINPIKGVECLVRAANIVVNQFGRRDVVFLLVGPFENVEVNRAGAYTARLVRLIKDFHLEDVVRLAGEAPFEELRHLYLAADLFVLPSVAEQFPLVALEAMAAGTPVVATRTPWAQMSIREGWNGMLVDVGDAGALAEKIRHVLDSPDEARRMGANAREFAREFDWAQVAREYAVVYAADTAAMPTLASS